MTEEQAKRMECVGVPAIAYQIWLAARNDRKPFESLFCQGADCMAWRLEENIPSEGYCGLANKP